MTPQEKAKELVSRMGGAFLIAKRNRNGKLSSPYKSGAMSEAVHSTYKKCALIAVDEILDPPTIKDGIYYVTTHINPLQTRYWEEVKEHINKL